MPCHRPTALALTALAAASAMAEEASAPADPAPAPAAAAPPEPPEPSRRWDAAVGLIASWGTSPHGDGKPDLRLQPGYVLRWGRVSLSNAGAFATRRSDNVQRGLGLDLQRGERLRTTLSLRYDGGRDDDEPALRGLGKVRNTVRARLGASWRLDDGWRLSGGISPDLLGRGGGVFADVGVGRERRLAPATVWNWGLRLSAADSRYLRSYYGVDTEQSQASGYPVYRPGAGWRDLQGSLGLRHDLDKHRILTAGVSLARLLGPAADGPAVTRRSTWSLAAGAGWRF
ncbi:hypothetical protein RGE_14030 [Rubrivivax gelatinosus IL144]|uniref:Outer membrane scaffolding protein for murein synthesis (MipA/OmpV family) n=2 Tax=Rubrivivax gelatinosus TaxID=28068 RepID=I0HP07_RUBGI|nr:hypothetical protein RGE_14030 [Rubrivivax gelatinosus IL144]